MTATSPSSPHSPHGQHSEGAEARLRTIRLASLLIISAGLVLYFEKPWKRAMDVTAPADPLAAAALRLTPQVRSARLLVLDQKSGNPTCLFVEYLNDGKTIATAHLLEAKSAVLTIQGKTLRFDRSEGSPSASLRGRQIESFVISPSAISPSTQPTTQPSIAVIPPFYATGTAPSPEESKFWTDVNRAIESSNAGVLGATLLTSSRDLDVSRPGAIYDLWLMENASLASRAEISR